MGQIKKLMMDYDEVLDSLIEFSCSLSQLTENSEYKNIVNRIVLIINQIEKLLEKCKNNYSVNAISSVNYAIARSKNLLCQGISYENINQILDCFIMCRKTLSNESREYAHATLNSSQYYENEIRLLNSRLASLTNELEKRATMHKEEISFKEAEKKELEEQILLFRKKEEQVKQREDVKATWQRSIQDSFQILDRDIEPIKDERNRLNKLFYGYCIFSLLMLILLFFIELVAVFKLKNYLGLPPLRLYLSLVAPVPIALALLFVFMTQINRAQRQMVALSKYIHDIKYIEGILLAINNLSVDLDDSMKRINDALSKLLDKHLSCNWENLDEASLKDQEKKDKEIISVQQLIDILHATIEKKI